MSVLRSQGARLGAALLLCALIAPRTAPAQVPAADRVWSTYVGGSSGENLSSIARSSEGHVVAVGFTSSPELSTDAGVPLSDAGTGDPARRDVLVVGFDANGTRRFTRVFGGDANDEATAVAVGPGGEIYVAGWTRSSSITGAGRVYSLYRAQEDAFLARLNRDGVPEWFIYLRGLTKDVARGVFVRDANTVFVTGQTDSVSFAEGPGALQQEPEGFVVKVTLPLPEPNPDRPADPPTAWSKVFMGNGADDFHGITADTDGDAGVFVTGVTSSTRFENGEERAEAGRQILLARLDDVKLGTPDLDWVNFLGGSQDDDGRSLLKGANGQLIVVGNTTSTDFGSPSRTNTGKNPFVAWVDNTGGNLRRIRLIEADREDEALGSALDTSGNVYVVGRTSSNSLGVGEPHFRGFQDYFADTEEGFVAMVPAGEGPGWASFLGGTGRDVIEGVTLGSDSRIFLTGFMASTGALRTPDGGTLHRDGGPSDGFLLAVQPKDIAPPSDGTVDDGLGEDVDTQPASLPLSANWYGFTSQSGLVTYEWSLGIEGQATPLQDFADVGSATSYTVTGLSPVVGTKYLFSVRATNVAGLSITRTSDGVTVTLPDGGTPNGGPDGGTDGGTGPDAGDGEPDGGDTPGGGDPKDTNATLGFGCASGGGAAVPLLLALLALALAARRLSASSR